MFRYATIASLTMFTSKWHANHAWHTEILIVKFPKTQELIN